MNDDAALWHALFLCSIQVICYANASAVIKQNRAKRSYRSFTPKPVVQQWWYAWFPLCCDTTDDIDVGRQPQRSSHAAKLILKSFLLFGTARLIRKVYKTTDNQRSSNNANQAQMACLLAPYYYVITHFRNQAALGI